MLLIQIFVITAQAETIFSETFEGSFPSGNGWTVGDLTSNPLSVGNDYWDDTSYRDYNGRWGGWSAKIGTQLAETTVTETIFTEGFEDGMGSWTTGDWNSNSGKDYWGKSSERDYYGRYSAWVADNGYSWYGLAYGPNSWWNKYDNDMKAYMHRPVDLDEYDSVTLYYRYWMNSEEDFDKFYVLYYEGSTWYITKRRNGDSLGWTQLSVNIPTTATHVGFYFKSDDSVTREGVYIDDVKLKGTKTITTHIPNSNLRQYDNYMDAYMQKQINLDGYSSATLRYKYWLDVEDNNYDWLKVQTSSDGSNWVDNKKYSDGYDSKDGDAKARKWYSDSIDLTSYADSTVYIRFLFHSDSSVHNREGAYLDDIKVDAVIQYGVSLSPTTQSKTVNSGENAVNVFAITNEGNTADTFSLSATRGSVSPNSVSLNAGASTTFTSMDSSTVSGTYTATITATSQGDSSKKATATAVNTFVTVFKPDLSISSEDITFEKVN